jgi:hypothetical protein
MTPFVPETNQIREAFARQINDLGGRVTEAFDDGRRLFARSVLPGTFEVRPGDRLQGGVAVRVVAQEVTVHPYVFRQVCRNGAIVAQILETRRLERPEEPLALPGAAEEVLTELAEQVRACAAGEVAAGAVEQIRSTQALDAERIVNLLPLLSRLVPEAATTLFAQIMDQFTRERDRSAFGLMNAITATARDTHDPELRWRLEELGGGIPALRPTPQRQPGSGAELALRA